MNRTILLFALVFISSVAISQKKEIKAVKNCFELYRTALLSENGEDALAQVNSKTVNYYSQVLENCKNLDSAEVSSLNLMDKLMVLAVRYRTPVDDILKFSGEELIVYAVNNDMIGKNGVMNAELGSIDVDGDFADSRIRQGKEEAPFGFHFYKENDQWKIDLTSVFDVSMAPFNQIIESSGMTEDTYLEMIVGMMPEKSGTTNIWERTSK